MTKELTHEQRVGYASALLSNIPFIAEMFEKMMRETRMEIVRDGYQYPYGTFFSKRAMYNMGGGAQVTIEYNVSLPGCEDYFAMMRQITEKYDDEIDEHDEDSH